MDQTISAVMTRGVRTLAPRDTVAQAAQEMAQLDVGAIPVCDGGRLVGMVTDRDLVLRAVAPRLPHDTPLDAVMSGSPCWCREDDPIEDVVEKMREAQIRRIPVVDGDERLVGIVSLGDLAVKADEAEAGTALEWISEPAAPARPAGG